MAAPFDDAQARLEADIVPSEFLGTAIAAGMPGRGDARLASTIDMVRYLAELEASEDADLRAVGALLRAEMAQSADASTMVKDDVVACLGRLAIKEELTCLGLIDAATFAKVLSTEVTRHIRMQDSLALFVVEYDDELALEDELRLVRAPRELTFKPARSSAVLERTVTVSSCRGLSANKPKASWEPSTRWSGALCRTSWRRSG